MKGVNTEFSLLSFTKYGDDLNECSWAYFNMPQGNNARICLISIQITILGEKHQCKKLLKDMQQWDLTLQQKSDDASAESWQMKPDRCLSLFTTLMLFETRVLQKLPLDVVADGSVCVCVCGIREL